MNYRQFGSTDLVVSELGPGSSAADNIRFLVNNRRTLSQAALQYALQLEGISSVQ